MINLYPERLLNSWWSLTIALELRMLHPAIITRCAAGIIVKHKNWIDAVYAYREYNLSGFALMVKFFLNQIFQIPLRKNFDCICAIYNGQKAIDATGYTLSEISKIEMVYESTGSTDPWIDDRHATWKDRRLDNYKRLDKVLELLCQFDKVEDPKTFENLFSNFECNNIQKEKARWYLILAQTTLL